MKVLHWAELFGNSIGGVEVLMWRLLAALRERGHTLAVVSSHTRNPMPNKSDFDCVPVHRFHFHRALHERDLAGIVNIRRQISELKRDLRPDLVHLHFGGSCLSAYFHLHTMRSWPVPTLVTCHGIGPKLPSDTPLIEQTFAAGSWVTAVSDAVLHEARDYFPEIEARSSVVHNGLASPMLAPAPLNLDPPTVLCLGRLTSEKGFDTAVAAFARVLRNLPHARLVIGGDGPERSALEESAQSLGVSGSVDFAGWIPPDRVPEVINASALVLVPSRYEAFGLAALEAAQMGRPVVATPAGGLPEIVADGCTGLVVDKFDAEVLAGAMVSLLGSPERMEKFGRAARERAQRMFGLDRCVQSYVDLYQRLIKEDRQPVYAS
jgi:glycogen synthase